MMTIPDELHDIGLLLGGARWRFQTMGTGNGRTVWVDGLHWRGCEHTGAHGSIGFGVQRDDKFLQFNSGFWDELGLDYTLVREVAKRMHDDGDAGDVPPGSAPDGQGNQVA